MIVDGVTPMCTDEDDEVFECEDPGTGGDNNRRSQSLSSLNQPAAGQEKVSININIL